MAANYEEAVEVPENYHLVVTRLSAYLRQEKRYTHTITNESMVNGSPSVTYRVMTTKSFWSSGENIRIQCIVIPEGTRVQIFSECKQKTQLVDWGINKKNVQILKSYVQRGMYAVPPEEQDTDFSSKTKKSVENKPVIYPVSCIYCGGHEDLTKETSGNIFLYEDRLEFSVIRKKFIIYIDDITDNRISTYQQILQRMTATRIALFGIFASAMPQKSLYQQSYLQITCNERGVETFIVFRQASNSKSARNQLIKLNAELIKLRKNRYQQD